MNRDFTVTLKQPEGKGIRWMEVLKLLTTVVASVAIPVVLVIVGKGIEGSVKSKELETKYVEISVGILTQPPTAETENLRNWAIDNINQYAEIKLDQLIKDELKSETLPAISLTNIRPPRNFTVPSSPRSIEYVVITDTENPSMRSAENTFNKPGADASYHYVIGTDGRIEKFVDEENIAWHAGKSEWEGKTNLNSITIGIGLVHLATPDGSNWLNLPAEHPAVGPGYPEAQIDALVGLLADIVRRHDLPVSHIVTKQDIAPNRRRTDLHGAPMQRIRERLGSQLEKEGKGQE